MPDRAWLHERIEQRLQVMWADGFLQEVIGLIKAASKSDGRYASTACCWISAGA